MTSTWKKFEDRNGFPYYLNEYSKEKRWDHPKFVEIRQRLDDCNYIKYSMYRVAVKFRVLQNALYMEDVPLSIVAAVFERHRLGANESSLCLECCDLEAVLSDIYFASNKKNHTSIDIDLATDLMLNFLYNVYDPERQGKLQVSSAKIVLFLLSSCSLRDLYKFIFGLCADHNNCVTRLRLQSLLTKLVEITTFLHEDGSYGLQLVNRTIEHCFSKSPGLAGICESTFISWLEENQKMVSWIPLLHRIKAAEQVIHSVKCTTCKINPLIGLRYRCTKCLKYTQCQRCFFIGRTSHSHKLSHSMREYCTQGNDHSYTFVRKMRSLLHCSQRSENSSVIETQPLFDQKYAVKSQSRDVLCNIEPLSSPQSQLQVIIRQLEFQNKELQVLLLGSHSNNDINQYLEEHRIHIAAQIEKLKILKDHLYSSVNSPPRDLPKSLQTITTESTPMIDFNSRPIPYSIGFDLLSPIVSRPEEERHSEEEVKPTTVSSNFTERKTDISESYSVNDISIWLGGQATTSQDSTKSDPLPPRKSPVREFQNDLDEALAKLQQILANNFSLDDSLCHIDNVNLKHAVCEVEGMLTSIIDSVESSRAGSVRSHRIGRNKLS